MFPYAQLPTSAKITGLDTLELSSLFTTVDRYANKGLAAFGFKNEGSAQAYIVIGTETVSGVPVPPQVGGVDGFLWLEGLDIDNLPKLYCPANAVVYVTPYQARP